MILLFSAPKPTWTSNEGIAGRRAAIRWLRQSTWSGVVYFADDDNIFDIRLLEEVNIIYNESRGVRARENQKVVKPKIVLAS